MCRINLIKGLGPVLQIAEGWAVNVPDHVFKAIDERTDPTWPTTFFAPRVNGVSGKFESWCNQLRSCRCRDDHSGFDAKDSGLYA